MARSRILYRLANVIGDLGSWEVDSFELDGLGMIVGDRSYENMSRFENDPQIAAADLLRLSVRADPLFKDAHVRLVDVLRRSVTAKRSQIVAALEACADAAPEAPDS